MVFFELKSPFHQPEPDSCVPTTLKVLFANQLNLQKSIATIKKWCGWQRGGVEPYGSIRRLDEPLSKLKISLFEKSNCTEKDIIRLLENGVLPLIYFRMNYYSEPALNGVEVDEEGTKFYHPIVPVGLENEKVYIYDSFLTGYGKTLPKEEVKIVLNLPVFFKEWQYTFNKAFWFIAEKSKNKQLLEFEEFKK